jgi:type IV secretory pathway VirB2 component (pilin)
MEASMRAVFTGNIGKLVVILAVAAPFAAVCGVGSWH